MEPNLHLKISLQAHGALRPEAWLQIQELMQTTKLSPGENLIRTEGNLTFIDQGILKEYDPAQRSRPAIISFHSSGQTIITRRHSQSHFIKAISAATLFQWDQSALDQLHHSYPELKNIYLALCASYDLNLSKRSILLETHPRERIQLFRAHHSQIIPYLKKKDIANYLHLNYTYLIDKWKLDP